jgi:hypothetical protein
LAAGRRIAHAPKSCLSRSVAVGTLAVVKPSAPASTHCKFDRSAIAPEPKAVVAFDRSRRLRRRGQRPRIQRP